MNSIYIFLDQNPWFSIIVFGIVQLWVFCTTIKKLKTFKNFFPENGEWKADIFENAYQILTPNASNEAKELVREVNEYLAKNEGTTDFGIIKDKTERRLDSLYEDAMSKISYPTYLGLMGTFFGVYIGLKCFNIGVSTSGVSDEIVSELIGGVIVSMITSLVGLILMMIGNWIASDYLKKVDADKNKFYDFLQVELMPVLGTSMVSALTKLHSTINTFEPAFRGVIGDFKDAFGECTTALRDTFGEKVEILTNAVDAMGKNMRLINENVEKQDELLKTLRQRQTIETLDKFTQAAGKFDAVTTSIARLDQVKEDIASSSETLVKAQSQYVEQMTIPERVFEKVNAILTRITTFEDSINALGQDIAQTQLLGNTQMNLIEEQITAIKKKTNLAVAYQETTDDQLKGIYEAQSKAIEAINSQYRAAIQRHGDDFETAMGEFKTAYDKIVNECKQAVEDKRDEYIKEINKSLNIEAKDQHLAQLEKIPAIQDGLEAIRKAVGDHSAVITKIDELKKELSRLPSSSSGTSWSGNTGNTQSNPYAGTTRPYTPPAQTRRPEPQSQPRIPEPTVEPKTEHTKGGFFGLFGKRK